MKKVFLILDFGSQYTHLIKARLAKIGFTSKILPGDTKLHSSKNKFRDLKIGGIILSGGASSVYDKTIPFDIKWLDLQIPVLGICYGYQLIASTFGGKVKRGNYSEFGKVEIKITKKNNLLSSNFNGSIVWMSHRDNVIKFPPSFESAASTKFSPIAAIFSEKKKIYGIQFHPEVSHTECGLEILKNFCKKICGVNPQEKWTPENFIRNISPEIRKTVKTLKVICAVSGGVDSLTTVALLRKILPKQQLLAIYVDNGLMPDKTIFEVKSFCENQDITLLTVNETKTFFEKLKNITNPSDKCKVIGSTFIEVFEKIAKIYKAKIFAQGTIWSDVVESGLTKFSSQIKPHHNVGGLPPKLNFILLEPLRELFKDQVRKLAHYLGLPNWVVKRKVFPGPGFAIRVQGEVTLEKVKIVKKVTKIIEDVLKEGKNFDDLWMAFAILISVPSLGIKGDERQEYNQAVVVRIIESKNSMTANFSRRCFPYLEKISSRIVNETEIGRVVYDITDKPPATIEWQ